MNSEVFGSEDSTLESMGEKIRSECSEVRGLMETVLGLSKVSSTPLQFLPPTIGGGRGREGEGQAG